MPWSNQNGGGGGWKGGGGPWGQGPSSGGGSPDLEDLLKRSQDRLKQALPGGGFGGIVALFILLAIAAIGYFGFFVVVQNNEVGVVLRFGRLDRTLSPGPHLRWPFPIEEVRTTTTLVNRLEIGKRTSSPSYSSTSNVLDEGQALTGDENLVEIDFVVKWAIKDAPSYLFSVKNAEKTVKDVAESAMREFIGQKDAQSLMTKSRSKVEEGVRNLMQTTLDSYKNDLPGSQGAGIIITEVQLQTVDPPSQVLDAFRDVQAAKADQTRVMNEAETHANTVVPNAEGRATKIRQEALAYKEQTVAEARGRADRFKKIYEEYVKAPDVTRRRMYMETMERVLGGTNKIILDEKGQGVVPYLPLNEINRGGQR
jgi:modulator of FtsH protease HflK